MDRGLFLAGVKGGLMKGRMGPVAVAGIGAILDAEAAGRAGRGDARQLAYILATAYHETARRLAPVRETLAPSDDAAIAVLDRAFAAGRLPGVRRPYWRRDEDGRSWLGRGFVQLTHKRNYERLGARLGIDLVSDPAVAMRPAVAAAVLVTGMTEGLFTGRRLDTFFTATQEDWTGARAIVNGADGAAARIGAAARLIHAAILQAGGPDRGGAEDRRGAEDTPAEADQRRGADRGGGPHGRYMNRGDGAVGAERGQAGRGEGPHPPGALET